MLPSIGQSPSPSSPFGALAEGPGMGAGSDPGQEQQNALMGQIRTVVSQIDEIAATNPALAPDAQQIRQLLRQMIVKSAQSAPMQTTSSMDVPSAG